MTAKTDSPIQTVGIAGRGAIGLLYGMQMRSGGVEPWYIADEERVWRYRQDPVAVNGMLKHTLCHDQAILWVLGQACRPHPDQEQRASRGQIRIRH